MSEGPAVIPEVVDRKPPVRRVVDGKLYVAGVHVESWQLTEEELMEFFPERYREKFGGIEKACPYPGCEGMVNDGDKRTYMAHFRNKHEQFYELHRDDLLKMPDALAVDNYVKKVTANV